MKIAMLIEEGATASSVSGTLDMFRLAQRLRPDVSFAPQLFSARGGWVQIAESVAVETRRLPADLAGMDAVIVPGFFAESVEGIALQLASTWSGAIARLRKLPADTLVAASCYGVFTLAEAGLLDHKSATTTWWFAKEFQSRYPQVAVDASRSLVESGSVLTAGAMTAHMELSLHALRRLGGGALARQVGGIMLVDGARVSQRPYMSLQRQFADPLVSKAVEWMGANLAQAVAMDELARVLHVSYRTLNRRFVEVAGMGPLGYLQALRMERVKALLEETGMDFEAIVGTVGYEDAASVRRLFKRATGLSPATYRKQFQVRVGSGPQGD
jgi:transcriptional regulator GlxA family with amidase domain